MLNLKVFFASVALIAIAQSVPVNAQSVEAPQIKPGDTWTFMTKDRVGAPNERKTSLLISEKVGNNFEGTNHAGEKVVMSSNLVTIQAGRATREDVPSRLNFPIEPGKKWKASYNWVNPQGAKGNNQDEISVVGIEKIKVAAGEFEAYKLVSKGYWNNTSTSNRGSQTTTFWYAPAAKNLVKLEYNDGFNNTVTELSEYKLTD
jgi:hypothetical protein